MTTSLATMNLADDFEESTATPDAARWTLEVSELVVTATMAPCSVPTERFTFRLTWSRYPEEPPSLKCVDPATGRIDVARAWPQLPGFRPASFDTCVNYSIEGMRLHPEWVHDPKTRWDPRGNPLLAVLRILQDQLDSCFKGRAAA